MNAVGIREGDIVECNVGGRQFLARVRENIPTHRATRRLRVLPLDKNISYREVTSRQVIAHFKRMGRKRGNDGDS